MGFWPRCWLWWDSKSWYWAWCWDTSPIGFRACSNASRGSARQPSLRCERSSVSPASPTWPRHLLSPRRPGGSQLQPAFPSGPTPERGHPTGSASYRPAQSRGRHTHTRTVYLPDDLNRELERVPAARGRSEGELIREAIRTPAEEVVSRRPHLLLFKSCKRGRAERVDPALAGFGAGDPPPRDGQAQSGDRRGARAVATSHSVPPTLPPPAVIMRRYTDRAIGPADASIIVLRRARQHARRADARRERHFQALRAAGGERVQVVPGGPTSQTGSRRGQRSRRHRHWNQLTRKANRP
jgi:hypothetical protein